MNFTNYNDAHITEIEDRKNWTDPVVELDPKIQTSGVVKMWNTDNSEDNGGQSIGGSGVKADACRVPIVKVNNRVIDGGDIISVKLHYDELLPHIDVAFYDQAGMNQFDNTPGFSNVITLIMTMPGAVTYKKVSIDFYITSWNCYGGEIYVSGEYKCLPLETVQLKQIKCTNPDGQSDKPSTYGTLWQIATDTGLGFAHSPVSPPEGSPIPEDERYRICSSIKYKDYIKEIIQYAGDDENSFMDCWIDLNGYIVLTNVSWVMDANVDSDEVIIKTSGDKMTDSDDLADTEWIETCRTLTNHPGQTAINSMSISEYKDLTDTTGIYYRGGLRSYSGITLGGGQQENTGTTSFDVELEEKSHQGIEDKSEYQKFQKHFFQGIEMSTDSPVLQQRALREEWFKKKRMRQLKVKLNTLNLGLQRGTLVNVMLYETDKAKIRALADTWTQQMSANKPEDITEDNLKYSDEQQSVIDNATFENSQTTEYFPNYNLCGMYYIDKMEFEFSHNTGFIEQTLYLLKKDDIHFTSGDKYIYPGFRSEVLSNTDI